MLWELEYFPFVGHRGIIKVCIFTLLTACDLQIYSIEAMTVYQTSLPQDIWSISPNVTAARALAIIVVLRAMSLFEGTSEAHERFQYLNLIYAFRTHGKSQRCDFFLFEFSCILCGPAV